MKFSLTKNTKVHLGITLYQIKAEEDGKYVKKGELGGYVEKKENLDMSGNAWVYGDARVYGKIKLELGFYFGMRYNNEEIKEFEIEKDKVLLHKGDGKPEFYDEEKNDECEKSELEIITLNGKKYKAID